MKPFFEDYSGLSPKNTLFLHGNLASTRWWQPFLREWQDLKIVGDGSFLFADHRGFGQNPRWPRELNFQFKDLAEDHLELLQSQGWTNDVALVGHSLGGLIALQMMALDPSRFSKALLLDPVGAEGIVFEDSLYSLFEQMATDPDLTRSVILSTVKDSELLDLVFANEIGQDAFRAVGGMGTAILAVLRGLDLRNALSELEHPILVLHGAEDQVIPLSSSEKLCELLPNAELRVLNDAGHCYNIENPKAFCDLIANWLTDGGEA